jgi:hypothetical protein
MLIYLWIVGKIFHRFLKVPHRTQKETVYVYLYNYSAFILLNIPAAFAGSIKDPMLALFFVLFFLTAGVYALIKSVKVFRYTHNVGFGRLMWAGIKSGLVVLTLGVPLLFMSSEKKQNEKASNHRFQGVLIGIAVVVGIFVLLYLYGTTIEDSSESTESAGTVKTSAKLEEKIEGGSEPVKPRERVKTSPTLAEKILGIWYYELEEAMPDAEGTMNVRGTTEYLRNGTSTSVGEISLRAQAPEGEEVEIMYSFMASGEWMLHEQNLVEKLVDMKTMPKYLKMNEEQIDLQYLDPTQRGEIPKIEDMIPMGISEEYEIIEIAAKVMRVKSRDSLGNEKIIVSYKRDKPLFWSRFRIIEILSILAL